MSCNLNQTDIDRFVIIMTLIILNCTCFFAKSSDRTTHTNQILLFLLFLLYLQVLLPPYDDSLSLPPKQAPPPYTTATAWKHSQHPADWTLLLIKPPARLMHHTASPVYSIFMDILKLHKHYSTPMHAAIHTYMHTPLPPPWPLIPSCYLLMTLCSYCSSSICPFCLYKSRHDVHFNAFRSGCNKALESLIDSIYFYQCYLSSVCTCNSILCVLSFIFISNLCTNAKMTILLPTVMSEESSSVSCLSCLCSWSGLDCLYSQLSIWWGALYRSMCEVSPGLEVFPKKCVCLYSDMIKEQPSVYRTYHLLLLFYSFKNQNCLVLKKSGVSSCAGWPS